MRNVVVATALGWMQLLNRGLTLLGVSTARPAAFIIVILYGLAWALLGDIDWHGFATLATWIMTLLIQRAEHRDTQAIQAKLDELLKAHGEASNNLVKIDEQEPEEIEKHRSRTDK
jgi:low affinity Fe/Cu permease